MPRGHWLVKSEPFKYAWDQLVEDGRTEWDGVRNYEARNNLRDMRVGDLVLYYHSNEGKEVVGVARVCGEAYPDPTTDDDRWVAVDVEPVQRLEAPVTLAAIKAEPALSEIALVKRGRISVVPITAAEFARVLAMGETALRPDARPEKLPPRPAPPRNTAARRAAARKATASARKATASARKATASARKATASAGQATGRGARRSATKAVRKKKKASARKKARPKKRARKRAAKNGAPARRRK